MNDKDLASFYEDKQEKSESPLSEKELASLIRASRAGNFKAKEIKKEMNSKFKKLSLHEIAKQALVHKSKKDIENKLVEENELKNSEEENQKNNEENQNIENKINNKKSSNFSNNEQKLEKEQISSEKEDHKEDIEKKERSKEEEDFNLSKEEYLKALEEAKKNGYEDGRSRAFTEIKEGADAAVATLKNITEELSKVDNFDLTELEKMITNKILELSTELSGKIIKALPADFVKKIKSFRTSLENIEGEVNIIISDLDYKILEKNKDTKKEISNLNISSSDNLETGEIELTVNGIKILNKIKQVD